MSVSRRRMSVVILAAVLALFLLPGAEVAAQTSTVLVSNIGQSAGAPSQFTNDQAQAFTTGSAAPGYKLTRVDWALTRVGSATATYTVTIRSNLSSSSDILGTLTNPSIIGTGATNPTQFAASGAGIDLAANTTYYAVIDVQSANGEIRVLTTSSNGEDAGAATGWSIGNAGNFRTASSMGAWSNTASSRRIVVQGYEKPPIE